MTKRGETAMARAASIAIFFDGMGFGLLVLLRPFIGLHFKGSPAAVTALVGICSLSSFLGRLWIEGWSDQAGRTTAVRLTLFGSIGAYLALALALALAATTSLPVLFVLPR